MATKRILIVDDEALILYALARTLARDGVEVTTVASAEEALKRVAAQRFDLCLLDHLLPGMTGLDAMPRLQEDAPGMKIVVITASCLTPHERAVVDTTACGLVEKPFDVERVREIVEEILAGSQAQPT
jgi:DNA-binding NtrC family response regulator